MMILIGRVVMLMLVNRQGLATAPVLLAAEQQSGLNKLIKRKFRAPGETFASFVLLNPGGNFLGMKSHAPWNRCWCLMVNLYNCMPVYRGSSSILSSGLG